MDHVFTTDSFVTIPDNLTVDAVMEDERLLQLMHDLLVLTSFKDNTTLLWRPKWFAQLPFSSKYWTLHNRPSIVTEILPEKGLENGFTRREKRGMDGDPPFIKSWDHWKRYCAIYGVPADFLCKKQLGLMRLGLEVGQYLFRNYLATLSQSKGQFFDPSGLDGRCRYPEPRPLAHGSHLLEPNMRKHLPAKFHQVDEDEAVVIHPTGEIMVKQTYHHIHDSSQWTRYDGFGALVDDPDHALDVQDDGDIMKYSGKAMKWCCMPWTMEMDMSCRSRPSIQPNSE